MPSAHLGGPDIDTTCDHVSDNLFSLCLNSVENQPKYICISCSFPKSKDDWDIYIHTYISPDKKEQITANSKCTHTDVLPG